jgi:ribosomal protein S18 acetylase RimI-like enzyme
MLVRRATLSDLRELIALGRTCYAEHFAREWSAAGLERYLDAQYEEGTVERDLGGETHVRYDVLTVDGSLVGFAKTVRDRSVPDGTDRHGLELEKIYVLASAVGRGYGAALLARVVEVATEGGTRWIWLDVLRSNEGAARFYERNGFVQVAEIPFATDVREIGMFVMCRPTESTQRSS